MSYIDSIPLSQNRGQRISIHESGEICSITVRQGKCLLHARVENDLRQKEREIWCLKNDEAVPDDILLKYIGTAILHDDNFHYFERYYLDEAKPNRWKSVLGWLWKK